MTNPATARLADRLFARLFWLLPTRAVSRAAHALAQSRRPWLKNALVRVFLRLYPDINMTEAAEPDPARYASFNALFTRTLAPGSRPLPTGDKRLVAPVDGTLGAFGDADGTALIQTKGVVYDLATLLGGDPGWTDTFQGGRYATFYLAPANYHRVHMPVAGRLQSMHYVPGRLFGVNPRCVRAVPRLFTRNERLVARFDTAVGPMALVMVGAFIVGGIHTRAIGPVCPPHRRTPASPSLAEAHSASLRYERGAEMGHFCIGSSVILLFGAGALDWQAGLASGTRLRQGQLVATAANTAHR